MRYFTLDRLTKDAASTPREERDLQRWTKWFETTDRTLALARVGPAKVELVFRGCDDPEPGAEPKLWELQISGFGDFETLTGKPVPRQLVARAIEPCETLKEARLVYQELTMTLEAAMSIHDEQQNEARRKPGCKEGVHDWLPNQHRCKRCDTTAEQVLAGKTAATDFLAAMEEIE